MSKLTILFLLAILFPVSVISYVFYKNMGLHSGGPMLIWSVLFVSVPIILFLSGALVSKLYYTRKFKKQEKENVSKII